MSPAYTPALALKVMSFNDCCLRKLVEIGIEGAQEASLTLFPMEFIKPSGG